MNQKAKEMYVDIEKTLDTVLSQCNHSTFVESLVIGEKSDDNGPRLMILVHHKVSNVEVYTPCIIDKKEPGVNYTEIDPFEDLEGGLANWARTTKRAFDRRHYFLPRKIETGENAFNAVPMSVTNSQAGIVYGKGKLTNRISISINGQDIVDLIKSNDGLYSMKVPYNNRTGYYEVTPDFLKSINDISDAVYKRLARLDEFPLLGERSVSNGKYIEMFKELDERILKVRKDIELAAEVQRVRNSFSSRSESEQKGYFDGEWYVKPYTETCEGLDPSDLLRD